MKKKIIRILAFTLACLMLLGVFSSVLRYASSVSLEDGAYAYGAGLNEKQIEQTKKLLGIKGNPTAIAVRGEDSKKYINENNRDSSMISSIYAKTNKTNSIKVEVLTPLMIQKVTSLQYSNAAITAGLKSLDISVAAIRPVTGTSALTGVYKLAELAGQKIDVKRTEVANEEIQVINAIAKEHEADKKFNKEKLNKAVLEIKQELVDKKEKNGSISSNQVAEVIQNVINNNNLNQVINQTNIKDLQVVFNNFININNLDLGLVKEQLNSLAKEAPKIAEKELARVKDFLKTDEGKKFVNSLSNTFSKENLNSVLDSAKSALDSPEVENILSKIKSGISEENINKVIKGAEDSVNKANKSGLFSSIASFISDIFKSIANFFKSIF